MVHWDTPLFFNKCYLRFFKINHSLFPYSKLSLTFSHLSTPKATPFGAACRSNVEPSIRAYNTSSSR